MCSAKSYKYFEGNLGLCHYPCHHALVVLTSWTFHEHKKKDVIRQFIWQTKKWLEDGLQGEGDRVSRGEPMRHGGVKIYILG